MSITAVRLIAQREIKARWALCPGALVFGILAMMVTRTLDPNEGGPTDMLMIVRVVGFLAAGMIGLSLLGDQLTDGRLSFYFARPFTPRAIFIGKVIGGLALALAIHLCLVVPVALGFPELPPEVTMIGDVEYVRPTLDVTMVEMLMGVAACVILGLAAGIVVRSRTRWLALDVFGVATLLVMTGYVVLHIDHTARNMDGFRPAARDTLIAYFSSVSLLVVSWLAIAMGALCYATARALSRGRIDREIAHTTLSKTLWPIVVPLGAAAVVAVVTWL